MKCEEKWVSSNPVNRFKDSKIIAYYITKNKGVFLINGPRVMYGFHYYQELDKGYINKKIKHLLWRFYPLKRKVALNRIRDAKEMGHRAVLPKKVINQICFEAL